MAGEQIVRRRKLLPADGAIAGRSRVKIAQIATASGKAINSEEGHGRHVLALARDDLAVGHAPAAASSATEPITAMPCVQPKRRERSW